MKGMRKTLMAAAAACALIFSVIGPAPAQSKKTLQVESGLVDAVALYDGDAGEMVSRRALLKVKVGEVGLRQSEAVFPERLPLPVI